MKFKPGIIGFILLACIALVCVDAVACVMLMRVHAIDLGLKLLFGVFNLFGVAGIAVLYLKGKRPDPIVEAAMEPVARRSKARWIAWLFYLWAGYGLVQMGLALYGIALHGWHWELFDVARLTIGTAFSLSLIYVGYLIGR